MNARFRPRHGAAYGVKDSSDAPLAENQVIKPRRVWGYHTLIFVLMLYLINRKRSLVRIAIDKVPTSMPKTPSCDGGSPWWQKPLDSASSQKKVEKPEVMAPIWNKMKQSIGAPSPTESMFWCDRMNWTHWKHVWALKNPKLNAAVIFYHSTGSCIQPRGNGMLRKHSSIEPLDFLQSPSLRPNHEDCKA